MKCLDCIWVEGSRLEGKTLRRKETTSDREAGKIPKAASTSFFYLDILGYSAADMSR